jgi:Barstar (barnase inhibitor)
MESYTEGGGMRKRTLLVEIDLSSVVSSDELFEVVSKAFGLSGRWTHPCGGKWDAFYEAIELRDDLPERLRLQGWSSVNVRLPDDARMFVECLDELSAEHPSTAPTVERFG